MYITTPHGTTRQQNAAHRNDLTWAPTGRSEYMRSDGVTIKKNRYSSSPEWQVTTIDGRLYTAACPFTGAERPWPAIARSLTEAKKMAEYITTDWPVTDRQAQ